MRRTRKTRRGFSLVEILAAMVLMGIVLPAAMRGVTLAMQAAAHAKHEQEAALLARRLTDQALVLRDASAVGNAGIFEDYPEYRWEAAVSNGNFDLQTLTIYVYWTEQGIERSWSVTTMILPTAGTGY